MLRLCLVIKLRWADVEVFRVVSPQLVEAERLLAVSELAHAVGSSVTEASGFSESDWLAASHAAGHPDLGVRSKLHRERGRGNCCI